MSYLEIGLGGAPPDEEWEPVKDAAAMQACWNYINLIRDKMGCEPDGAFFKVKERKISGRLYLEVVCMYLDGNQWAEKYCRRCEEEGPETWADNGGWDEKGERAIEM